MNKVGCSRLIAIASMLVGMDASAQVAPPAAPVQAADPGRPIVVGTSYEFNSTILADGRRIDVWLPDHYGEPGRAFPVLFLLDGGEKEDFLHIAGLTQIIAAYGDAREMIVVGVTGKDRRHDLTEPSSVSADRSIAPTSGGAAAYRRFLVNELQPWLAHRFATDGRTAIIGESLAGLFVLQTFLEEPAAFDDYIAVSPSLWWNGGRLAARASDALRSCRCADRRIWVAFDQPAPPASQAARDLALQHRVEQAFRSTRRSGLMWWIRHPQEGHASIYHPAALEALRTMYAKAATP